MRRLSGLGCVSISKPLSDGHCHSRADCRDNSGGGMGCREERLGGRFGLARRFGRANNPVVSCDIISSRD